MEYRYTSTEERVYADRGLTVNLGDVVDWPDGPPADGHWVPTDETQAEQPNTETPPAESGPTDTPTTPAPASGRKTTKE